MLYNDATNEVRTGALSITLSEWDKAKHEAKWKGWKLAPSGTDFAYVRDYLAETPKNRRIYEMHQASAHTYTHIFCIKIIQIHVVCCILKIFNSLKYLNFRRKCVLYCILKIFNSLKIFECKKEMFVVLHPKNI